MLNAVHYGFRDRDRLHGRSLDDGSAAGARGERDAAKSEHNDNERYRQISERGEGGIRRILQRGGMMWRGRSLADPDLVLAQCQDMETNLCLCRMHAQQSRKRSM